MLCSLMGYRKVDFNNPDTKQQIQGTKLFLVSIEKDPYIVGNETFQQFISKEYQIELIVGAKYDVTYSRTGKLYSIKKVG